MERSDDSESGSHLQGVTGLAGRLVDFAPHATEQLTEDQESALKKATVFLIKQLMLQQNKTSKQLVSVQEVEYNSIDKVITYMTHCVKGFSGPL